MHDYLYIDNTPQGRAVMYRMLNKGYIVAYKDSKEILIKRERK
jgi:hypothetical protein